MKGDEREPSAQSIPADRTTQSHAGSSSSHTAKFIPARDSRNRRVQGLYLRNGRFYTQLWIILRNGQKTARRFPLLDENKEPIRTLAAAREAMEVKRHERREGILPTPSGPKPAFSEYAATYFDKAAFAAKRLSTQGKERSIAARWKRHLGGLKLDQISLPAIASFVDARLRKKVSKRTVVLDLICLRNILKAAVEDGLLENLPRFPKLKPDPPKKRSLLGHADFARLLDTCTSTTDSGVPLTRNGGQLRDFLRFLAYSGAREQEALRVRWEDVDFEKNRVTIGADGLAKNRLSRTVEFNPRLEELLREMKSRRAPDSSWLFPSPQRGSRDIRCHSLRESLKLVRKKADLAWLGFHDLRHMFASICVMAGVDFMTIANWMGHKDGGILVGKVYGHLLDEHRHKMAKRIEFGPAPDPRE